MKILVDENIPIPTVQALRDMGHDVYDVRGTAREGVKDSILWELAQNEGRLLITTDKGFTKLGREIPPFGKVEPCNQQQIQYL